MAIPVSGNNTEARGPRYMQRGNNPNISRNRTKPIVLEYSWRLETSADTPVRPTSTAGQYTITTNFLFRYIFRQVVQKKYTNLALTADLNNSTEGFDSQRVADGTNTQSYIYPDTSEVSVFDLPTNVPVDYFTIGARDWCLVSFTSELDEDKDIWTDTYVLEATTKWMRTSGMSSKLTMPTLSAIPEAKEFI